MNIQNLKLILSQCPKYIRNKEDMFSVEFSHFSRNGSKYFDLYYKEKLIIRNIGYSNKIYHRYICKELKEYFKNEQ